MHLACARRPRDHTAKAVPRVLPDLRRRPRDRATRAGEVAPIRLRLVLPLLPGPGARPRPRRDAEGDPPPGCRLGRGPQLGRPPDAVPLGVREAQHRLPDEPDRQPVSPRRRLRRGRPLHRPAHSAGLHGLRRRSHLRLARRGRHLGGRVLGELEHRLPPAPAGGLPRRRQRLCDLGPGVRPGAGADLRARPGLPRPRDNEGRRDRLLRLAGQGP